MENPIRTAYKASVVWGGLALVAFKRGLATPYTLSIPVHRYARKR